MTTRLAILPYGPSDSCVALRDELRRRYEGNNQVRVVLLKTQNSAFRGRTDDIIINYGNRSAPTELFGSARVINPQSALNSAANKLNALNTMQGHGISTIPFTTDAAVARNWVDEGSVVYQRGTLNGHSGEGITVITRDNRSALGNAPLYTKGITGRRREWRVHVFDGVITHVQVKRRRNGYQDDPNYRDDVRNHHTGWIYATENINPSQAVLRNAVMAVSSMGLTFGAVDVISLGEDAWVLEVNTAAGLQAETTMNAFATAIEVKVDQLTGGRDGLTHMTSFPVDLTVMADEEEDPAVVLAGDEGVADSSRTPQRVFREALQEATPIPAPPARPRSTTVTPASPQMADSSHGATVTAGDQTLEDGYYICTYRTLGGSVMDNVIVWVSNNRAYRTGWNMPLPRNEVSNFRRMTSVTTSNGSTLNI